MQFRTMGGGYPKFHGANPEGLAEGNFGYPLFCDVRSEAEGIGEQREPPPVLQDLERSEGFCRTRLYTTYLTENYIKSLVIQTFPVFFSSQF
ncbi:MAG: hypothetical protein Q7N87_01250 [Candidatus Uhrbacteria bacterium]|nr:hypothetical protein [Candidatus Uhrbacteria bacterium]